MIATNSRSQCDGDVSQSLPRVHHKLQAQTWTIVQCNLHFYITSCKLESKLGELHHHYTTRMPPPHSSEHGNNKNMWDNLCNLGHFANGFCISGNSSLVPGPGKDKEELAEDPGHHHLPEHSPAGVTTTTTTNNNNLSSGWTNVLDSSQGPGPPNGVQPKLGVQTMAEKKPARRLGAKPPPDRAQKSMGCLSLKNPLRKHCIALVEWKPFEFLILFTIICNCVCLAVYKPYPGQDSNDTNAILVREEINKSERV